VCVGPLLNSPMPRNYKRKTDRKYPANRKKPGQRRAELDALEYAYRRMLEESEQEQERVEMYSEDKLSSLLNGIEKA